MSYRVDECVRLGKHARIDSGQDQDECTFSLRKHARIDWGQDQDECTFSFGDALNSLPADVLGYILGLATEYEHPKLSVLNLVCKAWQQALVSSSQARVVTIDMWRGEYSCSRVCRFLNNYSGTIQTIQMFGKYKSNMEMQLMLQSILKCKCLKNLSVCDSIWQMKDALALCNRLVTLSLRDLAPPQTQLTIASPNLRSLEIQWSFQLEGELNLVNIQSLDSLYINDNKLAVVNAVDLLHVGTLSFGSQSKDFKLVVPKLTDISIVRLWDSTQCFMSILKDLQNVRVDTMQFPCMSNTITEELGWPMVQVRRLIVDVSTTWKWIKWFKKNNILLEEVLLNMPYGDTRILEIGRNSLGIPVYNWGAV